MSDIDIDSLVAGVRSGDRKSIGQAITLVESTRPDHRILSAGLLEQLLPHASRAQRVGITGVPGVGKSTFIDALGTHLTSAGHRVAVLAVDPSSSLSGGSILGDKTRMARLAVDDMAFIRPSPSAGTLGGVTRATREAILVLEAAGYDVVMVETVGVGQSETLVHGMVDFFLVLMLAGAGDQLQGIKKGVLELADMLIVNKADGNNIDGAELAAMEYRRALHLLQPTSINWTPPVLTCSALLGTGLEELWHQIDLHTLTLTESGERDERRREQQTTWMRSMVHDRLLDRFNSDPAITDVRVELEAAVHEGTLAPSIAVDRLLEAWDSRA